MSSLRFCAALRKLSEFGAQALLPQRATTPAGVFWRPPFVSGRIANILRKQAISDGTYGTFNDSILKGWEPQWDVALAEVKHGGGRKTLRVPKGALRKRNRELRAQKIEASMEGMDERMEQHLADRQAKKPIKSIENTYKELMRAKK